MSLPPRIPIALAGVGNCASSLVQGLRYYSSGEGYVSGLISPKIGPYTLSNIDIVAAFDIDRRKVGRPLSEAIFSAPNCTLRFSDPPSETEKVIVQMADPLDGIADHMIRDHAKSFQPSKAEHVDIAGVLRASGARILVCFLPVGATKGVRAMAQAALDANVGFVNCVPVFVANDPAIAARFAEKRLPLIGDDVRSQVGATIVHQRLIDLFVERGYRLKTTYQLNVGGNTDFLNMLDRTRLNDKKASKTNAIMAFSGNHFSPEEIHVGPSDFVPHLDDRKIAFIHIEGEGFGGAPISLDVKLSVVDSPNSASVVLDAIRYAAVALDKGIGGTIDPACSYYMKSPPQRLDDETALSRLADMIGICG